MAGKKSYTSVYQVFVDTQLYFISKKGGQLTLGLFPDIARERWSWFVANFGNLRSRFQSVASGNINLVSNLQDLERFVEGFKLGNTKLNPFDSEGNIIKFRLFLDTVPLNEIGLTPDEANQRAEELERVGSLVEEDFRSMLQLLRQRTALAAQDVGLSDADAEKFLGLDRRRKQRNARIKDLIDIAEINTLYKIIEGFIYDLQVSQKKPPNLLAKAQENLAPGSEFTPENVYQTYIPVPFEISLESMAKKYLGSVQKWFELVTVNNLKAPYIDEVGQKYNLIAPPSQSTVIINSAQSNAVAPGVRVGIGSSRFKEESKIIENITVNEDDTMILSLSGEGDLSRFLPSENGYIRIFAPGTVRNNSLILIPFTEASPTGPAKKTPSRDDIRRLEKAFIEFGVDIARNERTNDILFDSSGNFKLAFGLKAVRQAVRNTLKTNIRELPYHPNYGVNYSLGRSYLGSVDEAVQVGDLIRTGVLRDQRLEDAKINRIASTDRGASLQMAVKVKGIDDPIPLAFVT